MLVRPDDHIAAILPMKDGAIDEIYAKIIGGETAVQKQKADA
jgi:3-(3-hydroxy-phenyl)propionate hydroxylase